MSARVCVLYRIVYTRYVYSCTSTQFQIYSEKALFPFIFSINITLMRHRQTQKNAQYGVCFVVCWLPLSYPHITSIYGAAQPMVDAVEVEVGWRSLEFS